MENLKTLDSSYFIGKSHFEEDVTKISELGNKISGHNHNKYITIPELNNLVTRVFNAKQANLITKTEFHA